MGLKRIGKSAVLLCRPLNLNVTTLSLPYLPDGQNSDSTARSQIFKKRRYVQGIQKRSGFPSPGILSRMVAGIC
jgi:hypothetical protein